MARVQAFLARAVEECETRTRGHDLWIAAVPVIEAGETADRPLRSPRIAATVEHRLLSADELAGRLGVDTNTLYRWSRGGRIPALKVGRWWRFRLEDVERALASASSSGWRALVEPLAEALRPGDHLVSYDIDPGLVAHVERAFVAAGARRGATLVRVTWDGAARRGKRPDSGREVVVDAASVPLERAERALRAWARRLGPRGRDGGLWIYGHPPRPPSEDGRVARLEAALGTLASVEKWVVLCLYPRSALRERARLAVLHAGELAVAPDGAHVLLRRA